MDRLPSCLWIVRHGESSGNIARDRAMALGAQTIDIMERDMDVPLSDKGKEQALALGGWFADLPPDQSPEIVITSPYSRAQETSRLILSHSGQENELLIDERLREKEFGSLNRLTKSGIEARYPDQARLRSAIGKFYYRPPGGESWCDVILRLRTMYESICLHYGGKRVLIVSHQVVVLCFRYIIENLDEQSLLGIDKKGEVANCSLTEYKCDGPGSSGHLRLMRYNYIAPLERAGAPVTAKPDDSVKV